MRVPKKENAVTESGFVKTSIIEAGVKEDGVKEDGIKTPDAKESGIKEPDSKDSCIKGHNLKEPGVKGPDSREPGFSEPVIKKADLTEPTKSKTQLSDLSALTRDLMETLVPDDLSDVSEVLQTIGWKRTGAAYLIGSVYKKACGGDVSAAKLIKELAEGGEVGNTEENVTRMSDAALYRMLRDAMQEDPERWNSSR